MIHKMLRPFIVKVSVLGYFPLSIFLYNIIKSVILIIIYMHRARENFHSSSMHKWQEISTQIILTNRVFFKRLKYLESLKNIGKLVTPIFT